MKNILLVIVLAVFFSGCVRGLPSEDPPVHPNPNMDTQYKYKPYRESKFFDDKLSMRLPVEGTVSRGNLNDDRVFYEGKNKKGGFAKNAPLEVNLENLERGRDRYNIYCKTCHSGVGDGKGIITNYGLIPPSFHENRLRSIEDGYIYSVIANGIRTMPAYKHSISAKDRWAIVLYVRALQRSQAATEKDIPEDVKNQILK